MSSYNQKAIKDALKAFGKQNVLVIGDVMIDSYTWGNVNRISPEAPVPIVSITTKEDRLGGAANVALNVQALGAKPILCSVIGNDNNGEKFVKLLKEQKLLTSGIIKSKKRITTVKTRIIAGNNQMLRIDEEIDSSLLKEDEASLLKRIKSIINAKNISAIIFEDYDKGVLTASLIKTVVAIANKKNIPTIVDPKKNNFFDYAGVTLFKPNLKELKEGLKADFNHKSNAVLKRVAADFIKKQKINTLLLTLSERGVFYHSKNLSKVVPAHIRNISDVSGAGDTVVSVAALCIAVGLSPTLTATLANLAGGLVCEKVGVVPIDKTLLLEEAIQLDI